MLGLFGTGRGIYSLPDININTVQGYTKKQVEKMIRDARHKAVEEAANAWAPYASMYRIHKRSLIEVINKLINQGKINRREVYRSYRSFCQMYARQEGIDLGKVENRFKPNEAKTIACKLYNFEEKNSLNSLKSQRGSRRFTKSDLALILIVLGMFVFGGCFALVKTYGLPIDWSAFDIEGFVGHFLSN
jgi:hypothetical protein